MKRAVLFLVAACGFSQNSFEELRDLIRRGAFAAAAQASERAVKQAPSDYRLWTLRGIALQGLEETNESLAAFRRAIRLQPGFLPALQGAAQIEYRTGDPAAARTLEEVLKADPGASVAHAMLGVLAFERRDCGAAIDHFRSAGNALENPVARWQYASCLFQSEKWDEAEREFASLVAMKEDPRIRFNLALAQMRGNKPAAVIATLARATDPDSISLLAAAHQALKQTPEALEVLQRGVKQHPFEERLYVDLASLCLDHHALELGLETVAAGRRNIPKSYRLAAMEGVLEVRTGHMDRAESSFREAERLAPDPAMGRVGLALSMMQMGLAEDAVRVLREAAEKGTVDPRVEATLVRALVQKGPTADEQEEAIRRMRNVLRRQPDDGASHALLGKLLMDRGELDSAAAALEKAIALDPADRTATYQLMTIYRRKGRTKEAAVLQSTVRKLLAGEKQAEQEAGRYRLIRAPDQR